MKSFLLVATLLALSGAAMADATLDVTQTVAGTGTDLDGTHTVSVTVGDDGSVSILVDGQPVGAPALP